MLILIFRVYKQVKSAFYVHECLLHYRILEQSAIHGYDSNVESKFAYPIKKIYSYMKTDSLESLSAYYSFAAIAYIVICQNGVVRNNDISYTEKLKQIRSIFYGRMGYRFVSQYKENQYSIF